MHLRIVNEKQHVQMNTTESPIECTNLGELAAQIKPVSLAPFLRDGAARTDFLCGTFCLEERVATDEHAPLCFNIPSGIRSREKAGVGGGVDRQHGQITQ